MLALCVTATCLQAPCAAGAVRQCTHLGSRGASWGSWVHRGPSSCQDPGPSCLQARLAAVHPWVNKAGTGQRHTSAGEAQAVRTASQRQPHTKARLSCACCWHRDQHRPCLAAAPHVHTQATEAQQETGLTSRHHHARPHARHSRHAIGVGARHAGHARAPATPAATSAARPAVPVAVSAACSNMEGDNTVVNSIIQAMICRACVLAASRMSRALAQHTACCVRFGKSPTRTTTRKGDTKLMLKAAAPAPTVPVLASNKSSCRSTHTHRHRPQTRHHPQTHSPCPSWSCSCACAWGGQMRCTPRLCRTVTHSMVSGACGWYASVLRCWSVA